MVISKDCNPKKTGRNEQCPCKSGLKFKYCCLGKERKERKLILDQECGQCGSKLVADFTNNPLFQLMNYQITLLHFFKDNDLFCFSTCTQGDIEDMLELLNKDELTSDIILDVYKRRLTRETVFSYLERISGEFTVFNQRKEILREAFESHFDRRFNVSIPVLFIQVEGILRDIGNLQPSDNFKPTIPVDIWDKKLAFELIDNARFFNSFISRLWEGKKGKDEFNRNPILHGFNIAYGTEEYSLILIMVVLEIYYFLFYQHNLPGIQAAQK